MSTTLCVTNSSKPAWWLCSVPLLCLLQSSLFQSLQPSYSSTPQESCSLGCGNTFPWKCQCLKQKRWSDIKVNEIALCNAISHSNCAKGSFWMFIVTALYSGWYLGSHVGAYWGGSDVQYRSSQHQKCVSPFCRPCSLSQHPTGPNEKNLISASPARLWSEQHKDRDR